MIYERINHVHFTGKARLDQVKLKLVQVWLEKVGQVKLGLVGLKTVKNNNYCKISTVTVNLQKKSEKLLKNINFMSVKLYVSLYSLYHCYVTNQYKQLLTCVKSQCIQKIGMVIAQKSISLMFDGKNETDIHRKYYNSNLMQTKIM